MELVSHFENYLEKKSRNDGSKWVINVFDKDGEYFGIPFTDMKNQVFTGNIYQAYLQFSRYIDNITGENIMEKDIEIVLEDYDENGETYKPIDIFEDVLDMIRVNDTIWLQLD